MLQGATQRGQPRRRDVIAGLLQDLAMAGRGEERASCCGNLQWQGHPEVWCSDGQCLEQIERVDERIRLDERISFEKLRSRWEGTVGLAPQTITQRPSG